MTFEEATESFLSHCRYEKNLSHHTLRAYTTDLRQFGADLTARSAPTVVEALGKPEVRGYVRGLLNAFAPKTAKRKVATLKALFNYLEREDVITVTPFRKLDVRIKEPRRLPRIVSFSDLTNLLHHLYGSKHRTSLRESEVYRLLVRDIAALEVMFATGARVSEVCGLCCGAVDFQIGRITILGKGGKERTLTLCEEETLRAVREYWELCRVGARADEPFFQNRLGRALSPQSVRAMLRRRSVAAGIQNAVTPHMIRHSVATLLLGAGVDIRHIQQLLGHSSIVTTQLYTQVDDSVQRRILAAKHPRRLLRFAEDLRPSPD
ncbi:MAG TPA: tyrosine-type recombinase/integrase [Longimicrobium sp.]|nr:tyrosine-type recombinase/integrase [Longimicrobium sp.]